MEIDNKFIKALKRRGKAYFYLGKIENSLNDFKEALQMDPKDKEVLKEVNDIEKVTSVI